MNIGRNKSHGLGSKVRWLGAALAPALALSVAVISPAAHAAPPAAPAPVKISSADCHVHAVLASKAEGGVEDSLSFLAEKLKDDEFAAYKSFYSMELKELSLKLDKPGQAKLKSGHKVGLTLLGGQDKRLELKFELSGRDGKTQLMSTKYGIVSAGVLITRIGSDEVEHDGHKGKYFLAIQCVSK